MTHGLIDLAGASLSPELARLHDGAVANALGPLPWRRRKATEARELCGLAQRAPRVELRALDLRTELRALVRLAVPVAVRAATGSDGFTVALGAEVAVVYPLQALRGALPGYSFVRVLRPRPVWHPNVHAVGQELCLGVSLPAGLRVVELVLASYRALAMQTLQVDEQDSAGVMHLEAARWWQANLDRAPLTQAGPLDPLPEVPA